MRNILASLATISDAIAASRLPDSWLKTKRRSLAVQAIFLKRVADDSRQAKTDSCRARTSRSWAERAQLIHAGEPAVIPAVCPRRKQNR